MAEYDSIKLLDDMKEALVKSARAVTDNFFKETVDGEYKKEDGWTLRSVIDIEAQKIMEGELKDKYPEAYFNLEETEIADKSDKPIENPLKIFGDPFDGTANLPPKLRLSTQALIAAEGDEFIAAAALHPFEQYILLGTKDIVYKINLNKDPDGNFEIVRESIKTLPMLEEKAKNIDVLMPYIDANNASVNFCYQRKKLWGQEIVTAFHKDWNGTYKSIMERVLGSNVDACMKLAEGRLHIQLTDTIGGVYDVAPGAVFIPALGGVMTDQYGEPLKVPKTTAEMRTTPQQVIVASVTPEMHEKVLPITEKYYGKDAIIYDPNLKDTIAIGEYIGFKEWSPTSKKVYEMLNNLV